MQVQKVSILLDTESKTLPVIVLWLKINFYGWPLIVFNLYPHVLY